jgi:hypothetical protein
MPSHKMKLPLFRIWTNIRQRCNNPNDPAYHRYGGRGIACCAEWDSYEKFALDVGPHPGKGWTLDRVDNNDIYRSGNVRWSNAKGQARNRRNNKLTLTAANAIRQEYATGATSQRRLAVKHSVSQRTIAAVVRGETWV